MKVLEVDVGNTFLKWRIHSAGRIEPVNRTLTDQILQQQFEIPAVWQTVELIRAVNVAGTAVEQWLSEFARQQQTPLHWAVVAHSYRDLKNAYTDPRKMGADRWVAMLAGWCEYRSGLCVIDAGSAVTVDWVDASGQHQGGYILPGLALLKKSLLGQTAQVKWQISDDADSLAPGRSTAECVEQGALYQIASLMKQVLVDSEARQTEHILLTGGDAPKIQQWIEKAEYRPSLVLDGLAYIEDTKLSEG